MGNVRTKDIKDAAFDIYNSNPEKFGDFEKNKASIIEMKIGENKRMRNKIAGYIVRVVGKSKNK